MDKYYVIDIPNDIDSLEQDYNDWCLLPYDLRKISNSACEERYGCSIEQLYGIMKARLMGYNNKEIVSESASMDEFLVQTTHILKEGFKNPENSHIDTIPGYSSNGNIADILSKIERSKQVHEMDDDWIVIYDFINDRYPDYTIEDLERMYNVYAMATPDHKRISDQYSLSIWGNTVYNMYLYMKNKLETLEDINNNDDLSHVDKTEDELEGYARTIKSESADSLQLLVRKVDCYNKTPERSVNEAEVLEGYGDKIKVGKKSYREDMPGVVPFLTYTEYLHNTESLDQKKINKIDPFSYVFNFKETADSLMDMYYKGDKEGLLNCGWNPEVKPNTEAFKYAREKQIKWFDENKNYETIDVSNFDVLEESEDMARNSKLSPIYLIVSSDDPKNKIQQKIAKVLLFKTLKDFSHMGVSFDNDLKNIYTFESVSKDRANKMIIESIDDYKSDQYIHVLAFFVFNDVKKAMKTAISNYIMTQDSSIYGFDNVMSILTDKPKGSSINPYIVIGSFLDSLFKISNLYDKVGKTEIGAGLKSTATGGKLFVMYCGQASKYKGNKVKKLVDFLKKNAEFERMNFFGSVTTTSEYIDPKDKGYYTFDTYLKNYKNPVLMEAVMEVRDLINIDEGIVSENVLGYNPLYIKQLIHEGNNIMGLVNESAQDYELKPLLNKMNHILQELKSVTEKYGIHNDKIDEYVSVAERWMYYPIQKIKQIEPDFQLDPIVTEVNTDLYKYNLWKPEI